MAAKIILAVSGLVLVAFFIRALLEPTRLELTKVCLPLPAADRENQHPDLRILFFSDLHYDILRIKKDLLQKAVLDLKPDLLIFTGDLAAKPQQQKQAAEFLGRLRQRPGQQALPFLAVAGNHDTSAGLQALAKAGVRVLQNEGFLFTCRGRTWQFIGLQDKAHGCPDYAAAGPDPAVPVKQRIVLSHNPDNILALPGNLAGCFLAGHFHGGQIWLPFRWEFFLLRPEQLARQGIYKGLFNWSGCNAYITRGLGCVLLPLRLFSLPELVCLEFCSSRAGKNSLLSGGGV